MALPRENFDYAERMRREVMRAKRMRREAMRAKMAKAVEGKAVEFMASTSYGDMAAAQSYEAMQKYATLGSTSPWGDCAYVPPASPSIITIPFEALKAFEAELEITRAKLAESKANLLQAQKDLQESQEIIEAVMADMEDVEVLKEENARLRIVGCLKVKAAEPVPDSDGWIEWDGSSDECPVPPDSYADIYVSKSDGSYSAGYPVYPVTHAREPYSSVRGWRWRKMYGAPNITKYRLVA